MERCEVLQSVCLSVCLMSVCPLRYLKRIRSNFTKFSVKVTCGRGSVHLGRQRNALCTSGLWSFVFPVFSTFSHNRAHMATLQLRHFSAASSRLTFVGRKPRHTQPSLAADASNALRTGTGAKSAIIDRRDLDRALIGYICAKANSDCIFQSTYALIDFVRNNETTH